MNKRANILFLMSDEHRADVTGYAGNSVIRTPVLDELARTGVVFNNAYAPSPVCIPSRQCMMAGQLPKTCGCEGWVDLAPGHMTFARWFARYSYAAVACGKLHHINADMMQGWTHRIGYEQEMGGAYVDVLPEEAAKYARPRSETKWSDEKEIKRAGIGYSHIRAEDDYALSGAKMYAERHFLDPFYDSEKPQQPLLLKLSMLKPHYPFLADGNLFRYYLNRVEPFLDEPAYPDHPVLGQRTVRVGEQVSEREVRRATAAYYAMIEENDTQYGQLMQSLRDAGQDLDDWIIVYTSDHGDMLGQNGIWEKQRFTDGSCRVPLIIRLPQHKNAGRVVTQNVNLCDIFATLCELCGLDIPEGLDSRSLVPLMNGNVSDWNDETVAQYFKDDMMIKRGSLKYQYYGKNAPEVLFDLAADPYERNNVIGLPQYSGAVDAFRERMSQLGHGPNADPNYKNAGYTQ